MTDFAEVLSLAGKLINSSSERDVILEAVCWLLKEEVPHYDWVGIYIGNDKKRKLTLGPFAGQPTDHVKIDYGKGICGQVAESKQTFEVPDVKAQDNYLACSPHVKSEIVVPILRGGRFVAQLDIDSHKIDPFTDEDRAFLEELCRMLADLF